MIKIILIYLFLGILIGIIFLLVVKIVKLRKKLFGKKQDLRKACIEKYGKEFGEIYDNMNRGIPVGGFLETTIFIDMIEKVKQEIKCQ